MPNFYIPDSEQELNEHNEQMAQLEQAETESDKERMFSIIKAVAHIGVDFGYGKYELEQEFIDMARAICEQEDLDT